MDMIYDLKMHTSRQSSRLKTTYEGGLMGGMNLRPYACLDNLVNHFTDFYKQNLKEKNWLTEFQRYMHDTEDNKIYGWQCQAVYSIIPERKRNLDNTLRCLHTSAKASIWNDTFGSLNAFMYERIHAHRLSYACQENCAWGDILASEHRTSILYLLLRLAGAEGALLRIRNSLVSTQPKEGIRENWRKAALLSKLPEYHWHMVVILPGIHFGNAINWFILYEYQLCWNLWHAHRQMGRSAVTSTRQPEYKPLVVKRVERKKEDL